MKMCSLKAIERQRIKPAFKILPQRVHEDLVVGSAVREQGHGGPELEIVGIAENLVDGSSLNVRHQPRTFSQPGTKNRMTQVGLSFGERFNAEFVGHRTGAETRYLRKDEPYPVSALVPGRQFGTNLLVDGILRVDEAAKVVRIIHDVLRMCILHVRRLRYEVELENPSRVDGGVRIVCARERATRFAQRGRRRHGTRSLECQRCGGSKE